MTIRGGNWIAFITGGVFNNVSVTGGGTPPTAPVISAVVSGDDITVTLDGQSGVTNHVYYKLSTASDWTSGGSRSGDGTIVLSSLAIGTYQIIAFSALDGLYSLPGKLLVRSVYSSDGITIDTSDKFLAMAYRLINSKGKTVTFRTYPDSVYDPTTGETTLGDAVDYQKKIIPPYPYKAGYIDGDLIKASDMQTGIAAYGLDFTPEPSDTRVIIDSKEWKIMNVQPVYSKEQVVLYMLQLRR